MQSWDTSTHHSLTYLRGARRMLEQQLLTNTDDNDKREARVSHASIGPTSHDTWSRRILVKMFIWSDIHTVVTFPFSEYASSWDARILNVTDTLNKLDDTNPFMFGLLRNVFGLMGEVRSILGQLYPDTRPSGARRGQLDHLFPDLDDFPSGVSSDLLRTAANLEHRIQRHFDSLPQLCMGPFVVPRSQLYECRVTTECYRRAVLLYLYSAVPGLTTSDIKDKLCVSTLDLLMSVPTDSPTLAFHSFILIIAGSQVKRCLSHDQCITTRSTSGNTRTYRSLVLDRLLLLEMRFPAQPMLKHARTMLQEVSHYPIDIRSSLWHLCALSSPRLHRRAYLLAIRHGRTEIDGPMTKNERAVGEYALRSPPIPLRVRRALMCRLRASADLKRLALMSW
jgi:hypothetical protein